MTEQASEAPKQRQPHAVYLVAYVVHGAITQRTFMNVYEDTPVTEHMVERWEAAIERANEFKKGDVLVISFQKLGVDT